MHLFVRISCVAIILIITGWYCILKPNKREIRPENFQISYNLGQNGCVLPIPTLFKYRIQDPKVRKYGEVVPTYTVLDIFCDDAYVMLGTNMTVCIDGKWVPSFGKCLKGCAPMLPTETMNVECSHNNKVMKSCDRPFDGMKAKFQCANFYEDDRRFKTYSRCSDGKWRGTTPTCVPVCGLRKSAMPLIVNGNNATKGEFPWQVALYLNQTYICGGTLLHERLILTAAHCVANLTGVVQNAEGYLVLAGLHNKQIFENQLKIPELQISSVAEIIVQDIYRGNENMLYGDIALIVPKENFRINDFVQPICIDFEGIKEQFFFKRNETYGQVSGWGFIEEYRTTSTNLRTLKVPVVPRDRCREFYRHDDLLPYLTDDKICAGFMNQSRGVCCGDSGSGLIYLHNGRYYILGIVSVAKQNVHGGCDSQNLAFYTLVSKHSSFIYEHYYKDMPFRSEIADSGEVDRNVKFKLITNYVTSPKPKQTDLPETRCKLPGSGEFLKGQLQKIPKSSNLTTAASGTFLRVSCSSNYTLDGQKIILCENGNWSSPIGRCLRKCASILDSKIIVTSCYHKMGKLQNCLNPISGTKAVYHCALFHEDVSVKGLDDESVQNFSLICNNGTWLPKMPKCVPRCGVSFVEDQNHTTPDQNEFPWVVSIYHNTTFVCSGTLLSEKFVLTAIDCLKSGDFVTNEDFVVVAGQYFRNLNFSDVKLNQISKISNFSQIALSPIILIELTEKFNLSLTVQPVCVDWDNKTSREVTFGYFSGWTPRNSLMITQTLEVDFVEMAECSKNFLMENTSGQELCGQFQIKEIKDVFIDRGGGIFRKYNNRYYIVGILTSPSSQMKKGTNGLFGMFTKIPYELQRTFFESEHL